MIYLLLRYIMVIMTIKLLIFIVLVFANHDIVSTLILLKMAYFIIYREVNIENDLIVKIAARLESIATSSISCVIQNLSLICNL